MSRRLLLVGAGGLAREAAAAATASGFDVVGYLDDDVSKAGTLVGELPVLGGLEILLDDLESSVVLCPGKGTARAGLATRLAESGFSPSRYATVVHPTVSAAPDCSVGQGSILLAGVVLTASVRAGRHVVVMPNATLTHDVVVHDFATVCSGVQLGGSVRVGREAYLGMAASVRQDLTIGECSIVGMGAVVLSDVPASQVWAGTPAVRLGGSAP